MNQASAHVGQAGHHQREQGEQVARGGVRGGEQEHRDQAPQGDRQGGPDAADAGRQRVRGIDEARDDGQHGQLGHGHEQDDAEYDLEPQRRGGVPAANTADAVVHDPPAGQRR